MLQLEREELAGKRAILTSHEAFMLRFADSGFKTKWSGFWMPPLKFMDYYAYKINGEWLSPAKVNNFSLKPDLGTWVYRLANIEVKEYVFVFNSGLCSVLDLKNRSDNKKAVSICLETALDFRPRAKDITDSDYQTSFNEVRAAVKVVDRNSQLSAMFGRAKTGEGEVEWRPEGKYKEHHPGERQICYLPGTYSVKIELGAGKRTRIPYTFSFSRTGDARNNYDSLLNYWPTRLSSRQSSRKRRSNKIETPSETLNKAFDWCQTSLDNLIVYPSGNERLLAGLPWFQAEWGRDALWSLLGLTDSGRFKLVERCLRRLADQRQGRIPNKVSLNGETNYEGADTDPLFLIALDYYQRVSGKQDFLREEGQVKAAFATLERERGLVQHEPNETWMDTLARGNSAIEIQSLWLEAADRYDKDFKDELASGLEEYWRAKDNYFCDHFTDSSPNTTKTINAAVPLLWGQVDADKANKALQVIGGQFTSNFGVRTLSYLEDDYKPQSYHQGSSWPLVTLWSAGANFRYGRIKEGLSLLNKVAQNVDKDQLGALPECIDPETGDLLGCSSQAWSEALLLHVVDRYLFGIEPNLAADELILHPQLPQDWQQAARHQKKIGDTVCDLKLTREGTKTAIELKFDQQPEIKLKIQTDKRVTINGELTPEKKLEKTNRIELTD